MKKIYLILLLLSITTVSLSQPATLSGTVSYKNVAGTLITDSCTVTLSSGSTVIYNVAVTNTGNFLFTNVTPGTYTLTATCTKLNGGVNAVDGLLILKSFVGIPPVLTGLAYAASDVNGSGGIPNAADALYCIAFFVSGIWPPIGPGTAASPWTSESFSLTLTPGQIATQSLKVLCTGDVNGSFTPWP